MSRNDPHFSLSSQPTSQRLSSFSELFSEDLQPPADFDEFWKQREINFSRPLLNSQDLPLLLTYPGYGDDNNSDNNKNNHQPHPSKMTKPEDWLTKLAFQAAARNDIPLLSALLSSDLAISLAVVGIDSIENQLLLCNYNHRFLQVQWDYLKPFLQKSPQEQKLLSPRLQTQLTTALYNTRNEIVKEYSKKLNELLRDQNESVSEHFKHFKFAIDDNTMEFALNVTRFSNNKELLITSLLLRLYQLAKKNHEFLEAWHDQDGGQHQDILTSMTAAGILMHNLRPQVLTSFKNNKTSYLLGTKHENEFSETWLHQTFLQNPMSCVVRNNQEDTLLHTAITYRQTETVLLLSRLGVDPELNNAEGVNATHLTQIQKNQSEGQSSSWRALRSGTSEWKKLSEYRQARHTKPGLFLSGNLRDHVEGLITHQTLDRIKAHLHYYATHLSADATQMTRDALKALQDAYHQAENIKINPAEVSNDDAESNQQRPTELSTLMDTMGAYIILWQQPSQILDNGFMGPLKEIFEDYKRFNQQAIVTPIDQRLAFRLENLAVDTLALQRQLEEERSKTEEAERKSEEEKNKTEKAERKFEEEKSKAEKAERKIEEEKSKTEKAERKTEEEKKKNEALKQEILKERIERDKLLEELRKEFAQTLKARESNRNDSDQEKIPLENVQTKSSLNINNDEDETSSRYSPGLMKK